LRWFRVLGLSLCDARDRAHADEHLTALLPQSTPAAVSDTNFYACNSAACSRTEGAALFDKKSKNAYVSLPLCRRLQRRAAR
jgi:hypothetical protein